MHLHLNQSKTVQILPKDYVYVVPLIHTDCPGVRRSGVACWTHPGAAHRPGKGSEKVSPNNPRKALHRLPDRTQSPINAESARRAADAAIRARSSPPITATCCHGHSERSTAAPRGMETSSSRSDVGWNATEDQQSPTW